MRVSSSLLALFVTAVLLSAAMPVSANPMVPYCQGSVISGATGTTVLPEVCEQATSRVFPEAMARPEYQAAGNTGYATDFVSYFEFQAGIEYLDSQYPERMEIHQVGESYGVWNQATQSRDKLPIYVIEVTNEESPVPMADRLNLLFMLSIHGNEKGGREGGFRVVEDLVAGKGMALETVQNGAGMPKPIAKPTGGEVTTYEDLLDFTRLHFLFPNADGWAHDEAEYFSPGADTSGNQPSTQSGFCGTFFCRTNGNGTDLNRQLPTIGWQHVNPDAGRLSMNEPEAHGYGNWMRSITTWDYAIDIHGMLNHENFVAIMMPAGSFSPQEMQRSTRLAETLKERLNTDSHFAEWTSLFGAAQQAGDSGTGQASQACNEFGQSCPQGSPTTAAGSGEFSDWSTVWDAIGYTDSGFSGDYFAQSSGLNAPGYDIELAYNHITVDSQYEAGAQFNDYHVHSVRHITKSFMDAAALDVQVSFETNGEKTLVIVPDYVATNLDDVDEDGNPMLTPGGWSDANPHDDPWQYSGSNPFFARPAKYWDDLKPFLRDGDKPGTIDTVGLASLDAKKLQNFDTLVIAGSAINQFIGGDALSNTLADGKPDSAKVQMVADWVAAGGNLVLTDSALKFLDLAGITNEAVDMHLQYAGAINLDREHALNEKVRGVARQTYEPVPLGFPAGINSPNWYVDAQAFSDIGGDAAGTTVDGGCEERQDNPVGPDPCIRVSNPNGVSLGRLAHGDGRIQFIGALLPDPTEEFYHPYGLDDYATTYSGNQILRNMLGWDEVFAAPPVVITEAGTIVQSENEPTRPVVENPNMPSTEDTPGLGIVALLGIVAVAIARRR